MKQSSDALAVCPYKKEVKAAYFKILKVARQLLEPIEDEPLRYSLIHYNKNCTGPGIIHEFINPMLYLRLEHHTDDTYIIHFGIEQINQQDYLAQVTTIFIRQLYRHTAKESTAVNIETAVRTDWFINSCSEYYEYAELRNKHHEFYLIRHKVTAKQRKQLLSVA